MPSVRIGRFRDNPREIAKHLNRALATKDPEKVVVAIGEMIQAQGVLQISKKTGMRRESLYRSFSGQMSPRFDRVLEALAALDVTLTVKPG